MTNKPRNRVVVFRLSQEEYGLLTQACSRAGARNLSDFTRSRVLECLETNSLEQRVAALQMQLDCLMQGVFHVEMQQS